MPVFVVYGEQRDGNQFVVAVDDVLDDEQTVLGKAFLHVIRTGAGG